MPSLTDPETKPSATSRLHTVKVPLWAFLVVVVLLVAMTVARQLAAGAAEQRIASERQEQAQKLEAERSAIEAAARQKLARHSDEAHLLFADALAWAIRSALLRNNTAEVDQYFAELVKREGVTFALLANADGKIVATSDRQFHGKRFVEEFPAELLKTDKISLRADGNERSVVLPIRGLTSRIGTALVTYAAP